MLRSVATTTTLLVATVALAAPAGAATTAARTPQVRITGSHRSRTPPRSRFPDARPGTKWRFDVARGAAYDVASFDVSWTTYVLP